MEVVASLSQGRTTAAQCGLFIHKSVPVIFEPPCISMDRTKHLEVILLPERNNSRHLCHSSAVKNGTMKCKSNCSM